MSSSSNSGLPKQFWNSGANGFRDASDFTSLKKRIGIYQVRTQPVSISILQSLQNRTSYQISFFDCSVGAPFCSTQGGFPNNVRLTLPI
jgi:hypothetical protein